MTYFSIPDALSGWAQMVITYVHVHVAAMVVTSAHVMTSSVVTRLGSNAPTVNGAGKHVNPGKVENIEAYDTQRR